MAYAFDVDETVPEAVYRITTEQVDRAVAALKQANGDDLDAAVHDSRKRAKKLRGLIRLVRPAMGRSLRLVNESFRDAGRELSGLRDAQATVTTFTRVAGMVEPPSSLLHPTLPLRVLRPQSQPNASARWRADPADQQPGTTSGQSLPSRQQAPRPSGRLPPP